MLKSVIEPVGQNCGPLVFPKLTISLAHPPDKIIVGTFDRFGGRLVRMADARTVLERFQMGSD
jgi:hypothetical protein